MRKGEEKNYNIEGEVKGQMEIGGKTEREMIGEWERIYRWIKGNGEGKIKLNRRGSRKEYGRGDNAQSE